jgi:hypothetical protein
MSLKRSELILSGVHRRFQMFSLSLNFLKFAAAGAIIALIVSGSPARADEMAQNLGPVGPHEPIITIVTAEAVADTAPGQQASLVGSNAQERETDDIKCVRQMPRYRPAPDFIFKC